MPAFDCLGDPVRRRILGSRVNGGRAVDEAGAIEQGEFGISQLGWSHSSCGCCETTPAGSPPAEPPTPDA